MLEPQLFDLAPGRHAAMVPTPHDGEEFLYVLSGTRSPSGSAATSATTCAVGDALTFPSTLPHRWRNDGQRGDAPAMDQHATDLLTDWDALRSGVPPVCGALHRPRHRPRRGRVARDDRWDALPRLHERHRGHEHRPRPPPCRGRHRRAGGTRHPPQQNIVHHQPGLELHDRLPRRFPNLPRPATTMDCSCRTRARRRSRRR